MRLDAKKRKVEIRVVRSSALSSAELLPVAEEKKTLEWKKTVEARSATKEHGVKRFRESGRRFSYAEDSTTSLQGREQEQPEGVWPLLDPEEGKKSRSSSMWEG